MGLSVEFIGYVAAALTTAAFAPQVWRTWRTRRAQDLSLTMLALMSSGNALWALYGLGVGAGPLVAANVVTLSLVLTLLAMKLGRRPAEAAPLAAPLAAPVPGSVAALSSGA